MDMPEEYERACAEAGISTDEYKTFFPEHLCTIKLEFEDSLISYNKLLCIVYNVRSRSAHVTVLYPVVKASNEKSTNEWRTNFSLKYDGKRIAHYTDSNIIDKDVVIAWKSF